MEQNNRKWYMRVLSWIVLMLLCGVYHALVPQAFKLIFMLIDWLSGLSTIMIIILSILFGGTIISILFYSILIIPALIVSLSEKICNSKKGLRYKIIGWYDIISYAIYIVFGITGTITGAVAILYCVSIYGVLSCIPFVCVNKIILTK